MHGFYRGILAAKSSGCALPCPHFAGLCYKAVMDAFDIPHLVTAVITVAIVIICVGVHYEGLSILSRWARIKVTPPRLKIASLIFGQLILHVIEIWIFAAGYFLLAQKLKYGAVIQLPYSNEMSAEIVGFLDHVYFSAVVYSTVGFGDLIPDGPVRFLTGIEAVVGLVLITWSASFTFLEMQRYWGRD